MGFYDYLFITKWDDMTEVGNSCTNLALAKRTFMVRFLLSVILGFI